MNTEQFITERRYLKNVSVNTLDWYRDSFHAFADALDSKVTIVQRITELRQRGVAAVSVNTYLRCVNAYFNWLHKEHGQPALKIPPLKEEQKVLSTFSAEQVKAILSFKPKGRNLTRAHIVCCLLLDTGLRISEALSLTGDNVDLDHCSIKVLGKGGKHRVVPISVELRQILFRYSKGMATHEHNKYLFDTKNGTHISARNFLRDFKSLGKKLGITGVRVSPHSCRHSFAVNYLRKGGNLEFLRRIMGHSSILVTQKYLRSLGVEDLQAVHNKLSLLSKA